MNLTFVNVKTKKRRKRVDEEGTIRFSCYYKKKKANRIIICKEDEWIQCSKSTVKKCFGTVEMISFVTNNQEQEEEGFPVLLPHLYIIIIFDN